MKKVMILSLAISLLASCGNNSQSSSNPPSTPSESSGTEANQPSDAEADKGLELITKNDCLTCHKVSEQLVGPAYEAVAARYKDSPSYIVDTLAARVIRGSTGHWGTAQMIPHPNVPKDDVKTMVKYVLSLKQ